tara:strand:- start:12 stop:428 length:417 start_codon:yes stop_codon:yes gene_type:complete
MAFGNLKFDTLTTSDAINTSTEKSIDTSYLFNGVAKVWADINAGQGSYGDSFNTTSITDNGTGDATMTHVNDMSSSSYSATTSVTFDQDGTNGHRDTLIRTKATGSTRCEFIYADTSGRGNQLDLEVDASVTIHGDLA